MGLPLLGRAPARAHAAPRPAGGRGGPLRLALQPGRALRSGQGLALHRDVPDEPPGGGQRHPARRPVRQCGPARPAGQATRRPSSATPTREPTRRPSPTPTTPASTPTRASCPASTRSSLSTAGSSAGWLCSNPSAMAPSAARRRAPDRAGAPGRPQRLRLPLRGLLDWIDRQDGPWFAHASYLRPHPPYAAAGHWSTRYPPAELAAPTPTGGDLHPLHTLLLSHPACAAPTDPAAMAHLRAQYLGMVSEVDDQIGRVVDAPGGDPAV